MEEYKNLNEGSGIIAYEIANDSISVQFNTGMVYVYTRNSVGSVYLNRMKVMAHNGRGLNSFIMKKVRNKYESKG